MGVLTVVLKKIDHLRDKDGFGKSDPYVIFHLKTDNWVRDKDLGTYTSTKKQNEINPVYNETFTFHQVPSLNNLELSAKGQ
jgi:Ca2+-dependent lipid-binding protein